MNSDGVQIQQIKKIDSFLPMKTDELTNQLNLVNLHSL